MPADYEIETEAGVVVSRAWGTLTDEDLLQHHRRLGGDPAFDASMNHYFDFEGVDTVELSARGIRVLAGRSPFGPESRRALVVDPDRPALFGMLRMYEAWCDQHPDEMRVQYDHSGKARRWIWGADPDADPGSPAP